MIIWKKSFVLAVAASCAAIFSVHAQSASDQVDQNSPDSVRIADALALDSKPFATRYRPSLPFRDATVVNKAPVASEDFLSNLASHISKASPIAIPLPSVATQPAKSVESSKTTEPRTNSNAPTVIVRPSVATTSQFNELTVEVNPMQNGQDDEFTLKIRVPDSVKAVELVPVGDADAQRSVKISLGQPTINPDIESLVDQATTIGSSSVNVAESPEASASSENVFQAGYKKNPFFGGDSMDPNDKTTRFQPNQLPRFRAAAGQSINTRKRSSNLASYRTASAGLKTGLNRKPITSLIEGTRIMGLGDTGDFVVYISNPSTVNAKDVVVKLEVAPGLDVVVLDRAAEINKDEGTLAWHLPSVESGQEHLIRYRVKSLIEGDHRQRISVTTQGNGDRLEIDADEIETSVVSDFDGEAPLLPFESN